MHNKERQVRVNLHEEFFSSFIEERIVLALVLVVGLLITTFALH